MFDFFKTKKQYQDLSGQAFKQMLTETPKAVLIDVRTPAEYKQGAIKGAMNADIMSNDFNNKSAGFDPEKVYLLYCRSGARSAKACQTLAGKGFKNVYNLSDGIGSYPR